MPFTFSLRLDTGAVDQQAQRPLRAISAVLKEGGEDGVPGYKPAFNFQMTLVDAVARWLMLNPDWLGRLPGTRPAAGLREAAQIWIGPPRTLSNQPPPQKLDQMQHIAGKFDVAGHDDAQPRRQWAGHPHRAASPTQPYALIIRYLPRCGSPFLMLT